MNNNVQTDIRHYQVFKILRSVTKIVFLAIRDLSYFQLLGFYFPNFRVADIFVTLH